MKLLFSTLLLLQSLSFHDLSAGFREIARIETAKAAMWREKADCYLDFAARFHGMWLAATWS